MMMFFVSGASAQLGERVSGRAMVGGGLALVGVGMAMLTVAQVDSRGRSFAARQLVAMIGTGLFNPASAAGAQLLARAPERPGRRRQRHVPAGRHRRGSRRSAR